MSRKWKRQGPRVRAGKAQPAGNFEAPRAFCAAARVACSITAADGQGEGKLPTFKGLAYTGSTMRPMGWWNDVVIDLDGVKVPSQHRPVLRQHDHEQIVGHTTEVSVDREGVHVAGVFSGEPHHRDKVTVPAGNGFQWQLSVGAEPVRTEFLEAGEETEVNGRTVKGPLTISRETEIGEISFVPLGADGQTSATVAAQGIKSTMNAFAIALKQLMADLRAASKAAKYSDGEIDKMSADEARSALKKCMEEEAAEASADDEDEDEDEDEEEDEDEDEEEEGKRKGKPSKSGRRTLSFRKEAQKILAQTRKDVAAEHQRAYDIEQAAKRHGVTEIEVGGKRVPLVAHAIQHKWTPEKTELEALRAARPGAGVGVPGGLAYTTSSPQVSEPVLEAAVLQATRHQFRLEDDSFYSELAPDGKTQLRRVPERVEREAKRELKARYTDQVQQTAHDLFKGRIGLQQLFRTAFAATGKRLSLDLSGEQGVRSMLRAWDHMEPDGIRAEGASNLSISNILANVLNKFALQGYLYTEQTWREICAVRPVNDFKAVKSINLLGDVMFKQVGSSGELSNASLGDQAFSNQAVPYGRILTLPWVHLVNDDLSMLSGAPQKLGQGAGLALNDNVWTLWANMAAGSVNGDDGVAFWRTSSSQTAQAKQKGTAYNLNKISGGTSALSSASLQTAKKAFDNQTDPNGNPLGFDGTMPTLLFGPSNWVTALELLTYRELVYGGASAAKQPQGNVWAGTMKPAMSRYIENASYGNSTTAWWILYNPAALPVIEVCFLGGVDTPAVLQAGPDYQFDRLGISIRGTMPFGSNQQNFRGGVYSVGA